MSWGDNAANGAPGGCWAHGEGAKDARNDTRTAAAAAKVSLPMMISLMPKTGSSDHPVAGQENAREALFVVSLVSWLLRPARYATNVNLP
jgi:hypothetical protein